LLIAILAVFRFALHQVDNRLEQMVSGSQPHPSPRNVADDDIDAFYLLPCAISGVGLLEKCILGRN
jgi:hypothetical protein